MTLFFSRYHKFHFGILLHILHKLLRNQDYCEMAVYQGINLVMDIREASDMYLDRLYT